MLVIERTSDARVNAASTTACWRSPSCRIARPKTCMPHGRAVFFSPDVNCAQLRHSPGRSDKSTAETTTTTQQLPNATAASPIAHWARCRSVSGRRLHCIQPPCVFPHSRRYPPATGKKDSGKEQHTYLRRPNGASGQHGWRLERKSGKGGEEIASRAPIGEKEEKGTRRRVLGEGCGKVVTKKSHGW